MNKVLLLIDESLQKKGDYNSLTNYQMITRSGFIQLKMGKVNGREKRLWVMLDFSALTLYVDFC